MASPCPYVPGLRYIHTESGLPLTVRYIGPLPPSPSSSSSSNPASGNSSSPTWIGVEWDDPARGKHSGTYKGEEVFRCRVPGAGSFLKWKQSVSGEGVLKEGKEFLGAVWDRYIDSQLPTTNAEAASVVLGSSNGNIKVEMPNIDKVARRLRRGVEDLEGGLDVKEIGLEGQWIRGVEPEGNGPWMSLRGKLSQAEMVNLSWNLVPTWKDLALLCAELPNLRVLVINHSRFEPLQQPLSESLPEHLRTAFTNIQQLHICHSLITWTDVIHFSTVFPSLKTLDLAGNTLLPHALSTAERPLSGLQSLDLSVCGLNQWDDVCRILRQTPDLRTLNISSNPLQNITAPDASPVPPLEALILNDTRIIDWQSIDHLQLLFGRTLRMVKYSVSEGAHVVMEGEGRVFNGTMDDRVYLIAKLSGVEILNGTTVTKQERTDAERFYLARAAKEGATEGTSGWGRLKELKELHGESQSGVSKQFLPTTLKSKMVDIAVECPDMGIEQFHLSLLPTAPIKLLKTKIARQLGVPNNTDFRLSVHETCTEEAREVEGDDRAKIGSLDLGEGDVVVVEVR